MHSNKLSFKIKTKFKALIVIKTQKIFLFTKDFVSHYLGFNYHTAIWGWNISVIKSWAEIYFIKLKMHKIFISGNKLKILLCLVIKFKI